MFLAASAAYGPRKLSRSAAYSPLRQDIAELKPPLSEIFASTLLLSRCWSLLLVVAVWLLTRSPANPFPQRGDVALRQCLASRCPGLAGERAVAAASCASSACSCYMQLVGSHLPPDAAAVVDGRTDGRRRLSSVHLELVSPPRATQQFSMALGSARSGPGGHPTTLVSWSLAPLPAPPTRRLTNTIA